jgi:hypothetical protein
MTRSNQLVRQVWIFHSARGDDAESTVGHRFTDDGPTARVKANPDIPRRGDQPRGLQHRAPTRCPRRRDHGEARSRAQLTELAAGPPVEDAGS